MEFEAVYAEHAPYVRRLLLSMGVRSADVDDVAQDTFLTVYRRLPEFEGRAALETWLYAVCWRTASNYRRRLRARGSMVHNPEARAVDSSTEPSLAPPRLQASLAGIEPSARDLFALSAIGGLSISELSELTGQARATVRRHLERATTRVERCFESVRSHLPESATRETECCVESQPEHNFRNTTYVNSEVCVSRYQNTVLARWRGPSTTSNLDYVHDMLRTAARETCEPLSFMSVIESTSTPPDRAGRDAIRRITVDVGRRVQAAAFTTRCPGLLRVVPPIINACVFLSGTSVKVRFFSHEKGAIAWLVQHTPSLTAQSLYEHVERMGRWLDDECSSTHHQARVSEI